MLEETKKRRAVGKYISMRMLYGNKNSKLSY